MNMLPYRAVENFADLTKAKDLEKGGLPWIIYLGPI